MTSGQPRALEWSQYFMWVAVGVVLGLGFSAFGVLVVPVVIGAVWLLARLGRLWPECLGLPLGVAIAFGLFAFVNRGSGPPCGGEQAASPCGGHDPVSWLIAAVALAGLSGAGLAAARMAGERD